MAPMIVILHGWGSDLSRWRPLADQLKAAGLTVVLPSLPQDKVRNTAAFADWLFQKTKTLAPFFLAGHSFGGQVAINFSARYPERVKKLILLSSAGVRRLNWKRFVFTPLAKLGRGLVSQRIKHFGYRLIRETDYMKASPIMKQTMKLILKEDQQENLKKIIVPTLLIWGRRDRYTPLSHGRLMRRLIKDSELVVIPGAKHGLPFTHVGQLKEKILWFIGSK